MADVKYWSSKSFHDVGSLTDPFPSLVAEGVEEERFGSIILLAVAEESEVVLLDRDE